MEHPRAAELHVWVLLHSSMAWLDPAHVRDVERHPSKSISPIAKSP